MKLLAEVSAHGTTAVLTANACRSAAFCSAAFPFLPDKPGRLNTAAQQATAASLSSMACRLPCSTKCISSREEAARSLLPADGSYLLLPAEQVKVLSDLVPCDPGVFKFTANATEALVSSSRGWCRGVSLRLVFCARL